MSILDRVIDHAKYVQTHIAPNSHHIMTVLIGSQNYLLHTENSDIDTFSFILPPLEDIIFNRPLISHEVEIEDGKCVIKDIRLLCDLLRKPSPNSVECVCSHYTYYSPKYSAILHEYLDHRDSLFLLCHANYTNMLNAIVGTAHGFPNRNMSIGKKYSHILRLNDMYDSYLSNDCAPYRYLLLTPENTEIARIAKTCEITDITSAFYEEATCTAIKALEKKHESFSLSSTQRKIETQAQECINNFQRQIFEIYLRENHYFKQEV